MLLGGLGGEGVCSWSHEKRGAIWSGGQLLGFGLVVALIARLPCEAWM